MREVLGAIVLVLALVAIALAAVYLGRHGLPPLVLLALSPASL